MIVVDSSGWIEFFQDGPKAGLYAKYLKDLEKVTPTVVVYEVCKKDANAARKPPSFAWQR